MPSNIFDDHYRQISGRGWFEEPHYEELAGHWQARLAGLDGRLLEIGCGIGRLVPHFIEMGFEVTGIDVSAAAIEVAQAQVSEAHFDTVDIQEGLPFPDGSFDVVVDSDCLHHLAGAGRARFVSEAFLALRPGGALLIKTNVGAPASEDWERFGYDPHTRTTQRDGQVANYFAESDEVLGRLTDAGFAIESWNVTAAGEDSSSQLYVKAVK